MPQQLSFTCTHPHRKNGLQTLFFVILVIDIILKAPLTTEFLHKAGKEKTAKNSMKINSQN